MHFLWGLIQQKLALSLIEVVRLRGTVQFAKTPTTDMSPTFMFYYGNSILDTARMCLNKNVFE